MKVIHRWHNMYQNHPEAPEIAKELDEEANTVSYALGNLVNKGYLDMIYPNVGNRRLIVVLFWE